LIGNFDARKDRDLCEITGDREVGMLVALPSPRFAGGTRTVPALMPDPGRRECRRWTRQGGEPQRRRCGRGPGQLL